MRRIKNLPQLWLCLLPLLLGGHKLSAAELWWDPVPGTSGPGDGIGQWSNLGSLANWWNGSANAIWNPGDTAVIGLNTATATTITVTNKLQVGGIIFSNVGSGAYTIAAASTTSIPLANATNILFTGVSPTVTLAAHNVTNAQTVNAISASVITTNNLYVVANTTFTNGIVRFGNITNNFAGGAFFVGTPGNTTYGGSSAVWLDMNTPTATDAYLSIVNNLTNVTVYSNATFRVSGHNTGSPANVLWPKQITISGDGRNGNMGAWIVTGNVGDNFVANVVLAGDSTIDFNAGAANKVLTLYGVISGNGRLQLVSGNSAANRHTCVLTNASTYVGPTIVAGGTTLQLINGNNRLPVGTVLTLGNTTAPAPFWNAFGRLLLGNATAAVDQSIAGLRTDSPDNLCRVYGGHASAISWLTVNSAASNYFGGAIGGTVTADKNVGIILTGGGVLTLAGTNLANGGFTASAGTIELGDGITDYPLSGPITNNSAVVINVASSQACAQAITGSGSLTKSGTGVLTLTGTNDYAGSTTVSAGTLNMTTAKSGTGAIAVGSGLELDLKRHVTSAKVTASSATFDANTVKLDFNLKGPNTTSMLDVTGTMANTGTMNIHIQNAGTLTVGSYPLIKYGSFVDGGASAFNLAAPISPRVTATIVNNTGTKTIELVVTAVDLLKWTGATDNVWDTTTTNWLLTGSASPINYADGELIQMDNTGLNTAITLAGSVLPGMMTVNNTSTPYSIVGSGSIGGSGTLVKNGSGSLMLAMSGGANQSGGTILQAGTLTLGDGSVDCTVSAPIENNSSLVFNVVSANNPPAVSGTGSIAKQGAGELTLDEANSYSGNTSVTAGSVRVSHSAAFGSAAGGTTVQSGAEVLVDASGLNIPEPLSIGGTGLGAAGALNLGDTMNSTWSGSVTVSGDTLFTAGFSSILTFSDSVLGGNNSLTFAAKPSSYFVLSGNVTAGAVNLGALPGDVATGGLHLNGPGETLTNVQVLLPTAAGTPAMTAGLFAKHSLALGTNSMVVLTNDQHIGDTGARLSLDNNVNIPAGVKLVAYCPGEGAEGIGGYRGTLSVRSNTTNVWNGPITIHGADPITGVSSLFMLYAGDLATGGRLEVNGNITVADGAANMLVRGFGGSGSISGVVNLGTNNFAVADGSPWTISSTGNTWAETQIGGSGASLNLGQADALCVSAPVRLATGAPANALDLRGYNQQIPGLYSLSGGTTMMVRNSSTNTDSTLKVLGNLGSNWVYSGTIAHVGGAKALHLDVAGDTLTLDNAGNNYTGNTTIRSGATLALSGAGNIASSSVIDVQGGGTLDVTAATGGSWTAGTALTVKGNGTVVGVLNVSGAVAPGASVGQLNVTGDVTLNGSGTALMEVNNSSGTNDVLNVSGSLNYGGNLVVTNISGVPYSNGQVLKLFSAGAYSGSFANIIIPGAGSYDDSNLTVNGTLTVFAVSTTPTSLSFSTTGGGMAMDLSWPADHTGWRLQSQTNSLNTGITTTWYDVPGSTTTNHMIIPVAPGNPTVFFRLTYP